jgi:type II secretory pathway component PulF
MSKYKKVSRWFLECGLRIKSGLPLEKSLLPCPKCIRTEVDSMLLSLQSGKSLKETIKPTKWALSSEKRTLDESSKSKLGEAFLYMARNRELKIQNHRAIYSSLAGFILLIHMAWVSIYFTHVTMHGKSSLFHFIILGTFWLLIAIGISIARKKAASVSKLFEKIPFFSNYIKQLQLSRFAFSMEYHVQNGESHLQAIHKAGKECERTEFEKASEDIKEHLEAGEPLWLRIHSHLCFPESFSRLIQEGAQSKDASLLAENLNYLGRHHQEEAMKGLSKAVFVSLLLFPSLFLFIYIPLTLILS